MYGIPSTPFVRLDSYVRQRLRFNFSCRGKKHGGQRQGKLLTVKYGNSFFIKDMGLITGMYMYAQHSHPSTTIDEYLNIINSKNKRIYNPNKSRFFSYVYAK